MGTASGLGRWLACAVRKRLRYSEGPKQGSSRCPISPVSFVRSRITAVQRGFGLPLRLGGDSRIAVDRISGVSKYLCPPFPDNALACFGSCTATPVCDQGYADSLRCYGDITSAPGRHAAERHAFWEAEIRAAIAAYFGIGGLAEVVLQASGT